ncbi:glycosyltransferase family 39 protein [Dyella terrae]|nr:glycosyltransferase family 39 protein [Dyella terrae]
MSTSTTANARRYWLIAWIGVTLLALGLRWAYLSRMEVDGPLRGDAGQYVSYAWNLVHHGVFSKNAPGSANVVPDSFRDPGYPSLLAALMLVSDDFSPWYHHVLLFQGLLGALTVALLMAAARPWLGMKGAVVAGLLMAIWPHSITFTGYLLSETATAFWVALGLFLLQRTATRNSLPIMVGCGIAFGIAALTNAVMIPFAAILASIFWWRGNFTRSMALALAIASLLLPIAWGVRNAQLPPAESSSGRALLNAIQGSWPEYHASYIASIEGDPNAQRVQGSIQHEYDVAMTSRSAGMALVSARMGEHPLRYLGWYASKPALLWDWAIRMGQGNIYQYAALHSLLNEQPILKALVALCWVLNPLIMCLALAGVLLVWMKERGRSPLSLAVAVLAVYVTVVYSLLQAEPRYSIPFRGIELILAVEAVRQCLCWRAARNRRAGLSNWSRTATDDPTTM